MKAQVKSCMTAGIAMVGAGAIAMTPIAPLPPSAYARTAVVENVNLLAYSPNAPLAYSPNALVAANQAIDPRNAFQDLFTLAQGLGDSGLRFGEAVVITPGRMLAVLTAMAQGPEAVKFALASLIVNLVDGPLWVADPTINALKAVLPAFSANITNFRNNVLWQGTQDVNAFLLNLLGLPDPEHPELPAPKSGLLSFVEGLGASALRFAEAVVITPGRALAVLAAMPQGPEAVKFALASLCVNLIDGPLWVADPTINGLKALFPALATDITNFRNNVLWQATQDINAFKLNLLGLPDPEHPELPTPKSGLLSFVEGLGTSALRFGEAVAITPGRILAVPAAIPQGEAAVKLALASLIVNVVDGPLWVADPTINGLKALFPALATEITNFRNNVLWQGTQDINAFLLKVLGLPDPEATPAQPGLARMLDKVAAVGGSTASLTDISKLQNSAQHAIKIGSATSPVKETPVKESPVVESPVKETPVVESPVKETPVAESPVTTSPVTESPATGADAGTVVRNSPKAAPGKRGTTAAKSDELKKAAQSVSDAASKIGGGLKKIGKPASANANAKAKASSGSSSE
jgi:hypothetical protein